MPRKKRKNALTFWLIAASGLLLSGSWVLFRAIPIEVQNIEFTHRDTHSEVSFSIHNNTSEMKLIAVQILSERHRSSEYSVGTTRLATRAFSAKLYPGESREFDEILEYRDGVKFRSSRIYVEAAPISSRSELEEIATQSPKP
ncbi:MAG: hypothetical protein AAGB46_01205 [Verrucomicrobiota bacterium]